MTDAARRMLILASAAVLLVLVAWGGAGLPGLGHYPGPYGDVLNAAAVYERHAQDVVSAVNFDYRSMDTLGEEFILFASVLGVVILLRKQSDEASGPELRGSRARTLPIPSASLRLFGSGLAAPLTVFGAYILAHGQLSPGGGFQGGVILVSVPLLLYLTGDYEHSYCALISHPGSELLEALGAATFALIGIVPLFLGLPFLQNWLPLGRTGRLASSGTIQAISIATGIEVAAGLALLMLTWFDRVLVLRPSGGKPQKSEQ